MSRAVHRAYLALGSNIEPERHLPLAVARLAEYGTIAACSQVWQSRPVGFADQPDFLNAAVLLETDHPIADILNTAIPAVERQLRRQRNPDNKNGPRTIDVDLVLYDREAGEFAGRTLPDPMLLEYPFIARPVAELDPEYRHPVTGESLARIAQRLLGRGELRLRSDVILPAEAAAPRTAAVLRPSR